MCVSKDMCVRMFLQSWWVYPRNTCNIDTHSIFLNSHYMVSLMYMVYCVAFVNYRTCHMTQHILRLDY